MKIFQIITVADVFYGAQKHVFELTEQLILNDHEVYLICGSDGILVHKLQKIGCKIIIIPYLKREISPFNDYRCFMLLKKNINKYQPDIVATHSSKAGILGRLAAYFSNTPNVFTAHGWSFENGVPYLRRQIYKKIERLVGKITDKVITVSFDGRELAIKNRIVAANKISMIHNGIKDFSLGYIRQKNDLFTITMIAGFREQKDHYTLINALRDLSQLNWQLLLLGDGDKLDETKNQVNRNDLTEKIKFLGAVDNVQYYLNQTDVLVLSTHYEGLPLGIIEGMSFKLPIIATNVSGIKEVVINNYNGMLVERKNEQNLRNAILYAIKNEEKLNEWGENSRHLFETQFTIEKMYNNTISLYNDVIKYKKGG